ncbi:hypothetical protein [Rhizobium sp. L51/94]|uniref:hypothetical protein n=1 Tax=Rhizobium sp. L51/94 TaxID=2819999 RepID=UPI001C5A6058|nr:hypothetical protein [Rhizobium sp. L51/94]QXZ79617.1 hypothetical protein J5274_06440 [Rhizobium sp. L51/94]
MTEISEHQMLARQFWHGLHRIADVSTLDDVPIDKQVETLQLIAIEAMSRAPTRVAKAALPCPVCSADEASTYMGAPGPGAVKCFAVGCGVEIKGFGTDEDAIEAWNRLSVSTHETRPVGVIGAFERDHPNLYWHLAKGKISAGEPLYGAIITTLAGTEIGQGESDISAAAAFSTAVQSAGLALFATTENQL